MSADEILDYLTIRGRCSSIIKVANDLSDIFAGRKNFLFKTFKSFFIFLKNRHNMV
jgi:hypothetical protein